VRAALALAAVLLAAGCGGGSTATPVDAQAQDATQAGDGADAAPPDAAEPTDAAPGCLDGGLHGRCLDPTTLERCTGSGTAQDDCAAAGALCGPDPADPASAACIAAGQACGAIDYLGACAGTVSAYCSDGQLVIVDCATVYALCDYVSASVGYYCTTECELAGVTAEGACNGTTGLTRCAFSGGAYHVVTETCPAGTSCQTVAETGWPGCVPDGSCDAAGPQGACTGTTLTRCVTGNPQTTDCAAHGQVCAYGGDAAGYACVAPGTTGAMAVAGTVRYEDRVPGPDGLGPAAPRAARGVTVAVVADADGAVLAAALTADDGTYVLHYTADAGTAVHVIAATTSATAARPVRVIRADGQVHGVGSPTFAAAAGSGQDLLATELSGVAPAFNIFDDLVTGMDYVRTALGVAAPDPIFAAWERGATDGTYFWDAGNGIFLLGGAADDDAYDDAVVLHEFGHYLEATYGRSDSPGGDHDGSPTVPTLAWSEGFATYVSSVVRGDRVYIDTDASGATVFDLETSVTAFTGTGVTQNISEDTVSEILWDVGDAPAADDDGITTKTHVEVLRVEHEYFRAAGFTSRGAAGVDLVDWLDGWFTLDGLGTCAPMRDIVTTARDFPYDYAGPAGACP
jgi:hypothetical protein